MYNHKTMNPADPFALNFEVSLPGKAEFPF